MVQRPAGFSAFEFVVLSGQRALQLKRGCVARVEGSHKTITIAQLEVAAGKVSRMRTVVDPQSTGELPMEGRARALKAEPVEV
jgi:DNA-directed RNA polymerase subunit K/omega